jgi:predicted transcriptional regulator
MDEPKSITFTCPSPRQIPAARVALDWNQMKLSKAANVGIATIKRLEFNHRDTDLSQIMQYNTLSKIVTALEQQGVEFTFEDGRRGVTFKG